VSFTLLGIALLGVILSFWRDWLGGLLLVAVGIAITVALLAGVYPQAGGAEAVPFLFSFGLPGLLLLAAWWRAR
jgi:hypothetical protein